MALLPLGPAAPAAPPPLVGTAAVKADAGMTVGSMRDMITMAREFVTLFKEAEPLLKLLRPAGVEMAGPATPAPAPEVAARAEAAPPPSEVAAANKEVELAAAKARADLEKLVRERVSKDQILQMAAAFGPLAIAEKFPKLGEALANHATETDAWLQCFSEEELRGVVVEMLPLIPAKDVPMARGALASMLKEAEKPKDAAPAAELAKDEPKKDGEGE